MNSNTLFFDNKNGKQFYNLCIKLNLIVHDVNTLAEILNGNVENWWKNILEKEEFSYFVRLYCNVSNNYIQDLYKIIIAGLLIS